MTSLDRLITLLSKLPGIGKKSATRLAYYILKNDISVARGLSEAMIELKQRIKPCKVCGNYSEQEVCPVCSDNRRDRGVICVVEQPQDVAVLESSNEYQGLYHVLNGVLAPLDGIGPDQLNLSSLVSRVRGSEVKEIILATNPTIEGDTTALYIHKLFEQSPVRISRLALGLPVGGDLEYADKLTLARSLRGRTNF
jgi:recombination protein RecR